MASNATVRLRTVMTVPLLMAGPQRALARACAFQLGGGTLGHSKSGVCLEWRRKQLSTHFSVGRACALLERMRSSVFYSSQTFIRHPEWTVDDSWSPVGFQVGKKIGVRLRDKS